jgi:hypothetical protein
VSTEDEQLVNLALARESSLPLRYARFARGLKDYYAGAADSAAARFREVLAIDSTWSEAWMALGEVYYHLLPRGGPLDSVAADAFERSRRADSTFTPPLLHLAEMALRAGDVRAAELAISQVRRADPDSALGNQLMLMLACVRDGPSAVDWNGAVRRQAQEVVAVGKLLAVGASNPACAGAAFRSLLAADSTRPGERWAALVGLQSLLLATHRPAEVTALMASKAAAALPASLLLLLDASAGLGFDSAAAAAARQMSGDYHRLDPPRLWLLGIWEAHRGNRGGLDAIATAMAAKRDSSGARMDSLLAGALDAHLALLKRDSADAIGRLDRLRPTATTRDLEWQLWEPLGEERVLHAELLLAQHRYEEAIVEAAQLDSPQPLVYLLYLGRSLAVRERAAQAMGNASLAARYRARASKLESANSAVTTAHR